MSELVVKRWTRYGNDRIYFSTIDGTQASPLDNATAGEKLAYLFSWFTTYGVRSTEPLLFQGAGGGGAKANDLPATLTDWSRRLRK